mmetsp:Transcript_18135/g.68550  ORF Transcript_18135/g.68550 Transcript_18135/m.68550 type:complete len:264 (+) Transcript_18135:13259-14050(+)
MHRQQHLPLRLRGHQVLGVPARRVLPPGWRVRQVPGPAPGPAHRLRGGHHGGRRGRVRLPALQDPPRLGADRHRLHAGPRHDLPRQGPLAAAHQGDPVRAVGLQPQPRDRRPRVHPAGPRLPAQVGRRRTPARGRLCHVRHPARGHRAQEDLHGPRPQEAVQPQPVLHRLDAHARLLRLHGGGPELPRRVQLLARGARRRLHLHGVGHRALLGAERHADVPGALRRHRPCSVRLRLPRHPRLPALHAPGPRAPGPDPPRVRHR